MEGFLIGFFQRIFGIIQKIFGITQVKRLKRGVDHWNSWRKKNSEIEIKLNGANLQGAKLYHANLKDANLYCANLKGAKLYRANLQGANLKGVNLKGAYLNGAYLQGANLYRANLQGANLYRANFEDAYLEDAYLENAYLNVANLKGAKLYRTNLQGANLQDANLKGANLQGAYLNDAYLIGTNLQGANLQDANLKGAYLNDAYLIGVTALNADFTNAILTGACIEDWNINSNIKLDNVICDYIYLTYETKDEYSNDFVFKNRRPIYPDKNFERGEFTRFIQKGLEILDLTYIKDQAEDTTKDNQEEEEIKRFIEFPPEYKEAGTSILTFFSHILKYKYPDIKATVKIELEGYTLRMIIDTPTGSRDIIEETLQNYGKVVIGKLPAKEFLDDPFEVMRLENQLEIAKMQLKQTEKLLNLSKNNYENRIQSLELQNNVSQNNHEKQIKSLELQLDKLYSLIEKSLEKDHRTNVINNIQSTGNNEGKTNLASKDINTTST